jgi:hypothetical protein
MATGDNIDYFQCAVLAKYYGASEIYSANKLIAHGYCFSY